MRSLSPFIIHFGVGRDALHSYQLSPQGVPDIPATFFVDFQFPLENNAIFDVMVRGSLTIFPKCLKKFALGGNNTSTTLKNQAAHLDLSTIGNFAVIFSKLSKNVEQYCYMEKEQQNRANVESRHQTFEVHQNIASGFDRDVAA